MKAAFSSVQQEDFVTWRDVVPTYRFRVVSNFALDFFREKGEIIITRLDLSETSAHIPPLKTESMDDVSPTEFILGKLQALYSKCRR